MPNIETHGFKGDNRPAMRVKIRDLLASKVPQKIPDVVFTIIHSEVRGAYGLLSRPFIRVASTDKSDRTQVALLINKELKVDVEWLHLDGFFEGKG